jgi:hypothetical protein
VVVILMGVDAGAAATARALADALGWRLAEGGEPDQLHATVARVLGRREHLVVASAPLTDDAQQTVRGGLHGVRFVDLADRGGEARTVVHAIRRDFGL